MITRDALRTVSPGLHCLQLTQQLAPPCGEAPAQPPRPGKAGGIFIQPVFHHRRGLIHQPSSGYSCHTSKYDGCSHSRNILRVKIIYEDRQKIARTEQIKQGMGNCYEAINLTTTTKTNTVNDWERQLSCLQWPETPNGKNMVWKWETYLFSYFFNFRPSMLNMWFELFFGMFPCRTTRSCELQVHG